MSDIEEYKPLILIADSNPDSIQILGTILKKLNYNIGFTLTGQQTLQFLMHKTPDLMIIDAGLSDIYCYDLIKTIQQNNNVTDFPVIVLSALNDLQDKIKAFSVGAVDYISKPFDSSELIIRVQNHIKLKQSQDLIRSYNNELERLLDLRTKTLIKSERQAAVGELLQGIVHNLKSPLTGIFFTSELLYSKISDFKKEIESRENVPTDEVFSCMNNTFKLIDKIFSVANRLKDMINGLMTKSQKDKIDELLQCDLNELVKEEISFLDADLRFKHEIEKEFIFSDIPLNIYVNPSEISQVIHNLIRNAIDALYQSEDPQLIFSTYAIDQFAYFKLIDNGPGIPDIIINKIFDPFFTTKNTDPNKTDEPLGTGLGLHFCRQTILSYNGDIEVESFPGEGTSFIFKIPINQSEISH